MFCHCCYLLYLLIIIISCEYMWRFITQSSSKAALFSFKALMMTMSVCVAPLLLAVALSLELPSCGVALWSHLLSWQALPRTNKHYSYKTNVMRMRHFTLLYPRLLTRFVIRDWLKLTLLYEAIFYFDRHCKKNCEVVMKTRTNM